MIKSWLTKFSSAVVISALAASLSLIANVLVLRIFSPEDAGKFTLVTSMAALIGLVGLLGQPNLINRLYARSKVPYHWQRDLWNTLLISSVVILVATLLALTFYQFTGFELVFVTTFSLLTVVIYTCAYMLNSRQQYIWSALLLRLANALFILPVGLIALGYLQTNVAGLLISQLVIAGGCAVAGMIGVTRHLPTGLTPISTRERKETFGMAILVIAHLLLDPGLIVIAGRWLPSSSIAGLGGYLNLLGPFLLIWAIMNQTMSVEFGHNPSFPKRKILLALWGALLPIIILSWIILPGLADVLYRGKYHSLHALALPISLMGGLLITETLPRGFVIALTDNRTLQRFVRDQILLAMAVGGLEIALVNRLGVYGAAWAGAILMLGRNVIGYAYFLIARRQLKSPA